MPIEPQKKDIDGYTFSVSQLPGMRGLKVFTRLTNLISGAKEALAAKTDESKAVAMLGLLQKLGEDDIEYFARELLTPATVATPEGKTLPVMQHFDTVFQGRVDLALKAILFALQVNYGGFLKGLAQGVAAQAAVQAPASTSPTA